MGGEGLGAASVERAPGLLGLGAVRAPFWIISRD